MSWETAKIGEVCTIEKGNIGIMKAIPGEYPLVVLGKERKTHNEFQFNDEAVIIPLVSSTGHGHRSMNRVFFQTGKFSIGSILCAVIPKDKTQLSAEFLYRYLDFNKENELVARMRGMANVTLPMKEIADVEIPLPPLEVQKQLIEEFQKLESGTNQISTELNHQSALVKELRQAYLREAMQGKLVPQDSADEPAEILLKKIKAEKEKLVTEKRIRRDKPFPPILPEEIPFEIPLNWIWCRLGEICEFSPRNKAEDDLKVGFIPMPLISQKYLQMPTFEIRDWKSIKSGFTHFANNDVVLAKITPCFENSKAGIVKNLPNGIGAGTTELYVMRGNEFILPEFIYAFVKTKDFLKNGERIMRGVAGQQRVPSEYVYNSYFPLPPLAEQERIVAKLEKLMKFCDELEANIKQGITNADQLLQTALKEALEPK